MTQITFPTHIKTDFFVDVNVGEAGSFYDNPDDAPGPFCVEYRNGHTTGHATEAEACTVQRAWRLAHARHPMTGEPLLGLLQDLVGLADEAVTSREIDPEEDNTEEMSAAHRQTVNDGEALLQALRDH